MSPDDTKPPSGPATTPTLSSDLADTVIAAGEAEEVLARALDDLSGTFLRLEALAMACARALDATAKPTESPAA